VHDADARRQQLEPFALEGCVERAEDTGGEVEGKDQPTVRLVDEERGRVLKILYPGGRYPPPLSSSFLLLLKESGS
jgi:hypothetical protein